MFVFVFSLICEQFQLCYSQDKMFCDQDDTVFDNFQSLIDNIVETQSKLNTYIIKINQKDTELIFDFSVATDNINYLFIGNSSPNKILFKNLDTLDILIIRNMTAEIDHTGILTMSSFVVNQFSNITFTNNPILEIGTITCPYSTFYTVTDIRAYNQINIVGNEIPTKDLKLYNPREISVNILDKATVLAKGDKLQITYSNGKIITFPLISGTEGVLSKSHIKFNMDSTLILDELYLSWETPELDIMIEDCVLTVDQKREDKIADSSIRLLGNAILSSEKEYSVSKLYVKNQSNILRANIIDTEVIVGDNTEFIVDIPNSDFISIELKTNSTLSSKYVISSEIISTINNSPNGVINIDATVNVSEQLKYGSTKLIVRELILYQYGLLTCVHHLSGVFPCTIYKATKINFIFSTNSAYSTEQNEILFDDMFWARNNVFDVIETNLSIKKINLISDAASISEIVIFQSNTFMSLIRNGTMVQFKYLTSPFSINSKFCFGGNIDDSICKQTPRYFYQSYTDTWKKRLSPYSQRITLAFTDIKETVDMGILQDTHTFILQLFGNSEISIICSDRLVNFQILYVSGGTINFDFYNFTKLSMLLAILDTNITLKNCNMIHNLFQGFSASNSIVKFNDKFTLEKTMISMKNSTFIGEFDFKSSMRAFIDLSALDYVKSLPLMIDLQLSNLVKEFEIGDNFVKFTDQQNKVKTIDTNPELVLSLSFENLIEDYNPIFRCSAKDETRVAQIYVDRIQKYQIKGKWPTTKTPILKHNQIYDQLNPHIHVQTDGDFPIGIPESFDMKNVYFESQNDIMFSYGLESSSENFYPFFYSEKNIIIPSFKSMNCPGLGFYSKSAKLTIKEFEPRGSEIELVSVNINNISLNNSKVTGIETNLENSFVKLTIPKSGNLSIFETTGKCQIDKMVILFENETQLIYNNSRIICCNSGISAKNIDSSLSISENCLLYIQNNSSSGKSKVQLALLITGLSVGIILTILAIIILIICLRRKKDEPKSVIEQKFLESEL